MQGPKRARREIPLAGKDRRAGKIRHSPQNNLPAALRAGDGHTYSRPQSNRGWQPSLGQGFGDMGEKNDGFASVYMAFRGVMGRAVRRIVPNRDVEDILQEAFVRSYEAQRRHPILDARAFLLRTATNLALNHVSRAGYRTTGSFDELDADRAGW